MDRAIRLYRQAAQAGDALGQYRLGEVYLRGAGVKRDLHEAFRWMELAARNGDVPAMLKVGILQLMGVNGRVELAEAKQWLYQASQRATRWHSRCCRRWRWPRRAQRLRFQWPLFF